MLISPADGWIQVATGSAIVQKNGTSHLQLTYSSSKPTSVDNIFVMRHNLSELYAESTGKVLWARAVTGPVRLAVESTT